MLKKIKHKDVWDFTWHYWKKQSNKGMVLVSLMVIATVVDTFVPVYTGKIIDTLVSATPENNQAMNNALSYLLVFMALGFTFHMLRWFAISLWARFAVNCLYSVLTDAVCDLAMGKICGKLPLQCPDRCAAQGTAFQF